MQRLSDRGWNFSGVKYCCIFSSTKRKRNTGLTKQVCFGLERYNGLQILLYWLEKYCDFHYCQIFSSQMYWKAFCLRGQRPADQKAHLSLMDRGLSVAEMGVVHYEKIYKSSQELGLLSCTLRSNQALKLPPKNKPRNYASLVRHKLQKREQVTVTFHILLVLSVSRKKTQVMKLPFEDQY